MVSADELILPDLRIDPADDLPDCDASLSFGMFPPPGHPRCPNRAEWRWIFQGCDCGEMQVQLCTVHHYRELKVEQGSGCPTFICSHHRPNQRTECIRKELIR